MALTYNQRLENLRISIFDIINPRRTISDNAISDGNVDNVRESDKQVWLTTLRRYKNLEDLRDWASTADLQGTFGDDLRDPILVKIDRAITTRQALIDSMTLRLIRTVENSPGVDSAVITNATRLNPDGKTVGVTIESIATAFVNRGTEIGVASSRLLEDYDIPPALLTQNSITTDGAPVAEADVAPDAAPESALEEAKNIARFAGLDPEVVKTADSVQQVRDMMAFTMNAGGLSANEVAALVAFDEQMEVAGVTALTKMEDGFSSPVAGTGGGMGAGDIVADAVAPARAIVDAPASGPAPEPTAAEIAAVGEIYASGDAQRIADWERFANLPPSASPSASPVAFTLVRGDGVGMGITQLVGNGAAVYVMNSDGTKLHVTGEMAEQLRASGAWTEPTIVNQTTLDQSTTIGTLASVDGGVGGLVVPLHAVASSAPAPAPAPVAAPVAAPTLSQPQRDQIAGMYRQYLGREAAPNEIDHHGAAVLNGSYTMDQINLNIANSPEARGYSANVLAQADAGRIAGINVQVDSLFRQYVGRAADAEDLRIHGASLANGSVSVGTLAQQLAAAPESQAYRTNLINNTFQHFVGRAADSDDHQIHGTALASGAVDANQFVSSIAHAPEAIGYQTSVGMPRYTQ